MWRGGLRLRFHTPLIEPCRRVSRTRLSDKDSCGRSHEAALPTLQAHQTQSLVKVSVGEACRPPTPHLVLPAQPMTEPSPRVGVHGAVGFADLPQPEVVGPPVQLLVEATHQLLDVEQAPAPTRLLADRAAEPLDLLRRRSRPDVGLARLRATQADRVTQEVERLLGDLATPG